jgi:predicted membrane protein
MPLNDPQSDHGWEFPARAIPAVVLIVIGTLFLLGNVHILPSMNWFDFWPVILIVIGLMKLLEAPRKGSYVGGAVLFGLGAVFLTDNLHILPFSVWDLWPVLLIAIGAGLLFERLPWGGRPDWAGRRGCCGPRVSVASGSGGLHLTAIFSGGKRKYDGQEFSGGVVEAVFGGFELDLRKAMMPGGSAALHVNVIFGGCEIKIPESWNVELQGAAMFGGFSDETRHPLAGAPETKQFIVKGAAVFGGVVVKN